MIVRTEQIIIFMLACLISIGCVLQHEALASEDITNGKGSTIAETLINDYKSFYACERLIRMGLGFGLGAKPIINRYGFCFSNPEDEGSLYKGKEFTQKMLEINRKRLLALEL